ncbi:MAG: hypothetical protein IBX39_06760 [Candidatus Methanoperedenaceae archaeon]|nr:hypothetical protein [Candidatus Methanoperedenaceae archaeon]
MFKIVGLRQEADSKMYGKIKRAVTSLMLPVEENRAGECKNCGSCCMLVFRCPFIKFKENGSIKAVCTVYQFRPPQCMKYPRAESEQVHKQCGYYFK